MPVSRRGFLTSVTASSAGILALPLISARGSEALAAFDPTSNSPRPGLLSSPSIRLDSNENPNGPGARVLNTLRSALDLANRYPTSITSETRDAIAKARGVDSNAVMLSCGSGEVLRVAVQAFTSPTQALVVAAPTFESPARTATLLKAPVRAIRVDSALRLDLDAMALAANGAGLVYLCNPNNPTATVHGASDVQAFVDEIGRSSPNTTVLIDEAYHEYVDDPAYASAIPLAMSNPRVIVARTFSKVYGMAGMRIGYAIAQPATLLLMSPWLLGMGLNQPALAAARVAVSDTGHVADEQRLNRAARAFTQTFFANGGFTMGVPQANFMMVDIRRDAASFIGACADRGVSVGRLFPPLDTHVRITIGTMREMHQAVDVFKSLLAN